MAYYFWHGLDFQGSRISGALKVPKRIDAIKKLRNKRIFLSRLHEISPYRLRVIFSGAGLRSAAFFDSNVQKPQPSSWTRTFLAHKDAGEVQ